MAKRDRTLRVALAAQDDIAAILAHTLQTFGTGQARSYRMLIEQALLRIQRDPLHVECRTRPEIHPSARMLHLGKGARHFVLFRIVDEQIVEVARVLYDGMDLTQHVPKSYRP